MSDDGQKQSMTAKIVGAGVTLIAAWAVQKIINAAWKKAKGHELPSPDSTADDIKFSEVAAAAAISGAAISLSRVLATRGAAKLAGRARH
ncbi:DUF4235 domain-containing protein [Cellulomonas xiejunii]|uniref:DUF4235 domain-containing protein n=1 Tax=Cellulomonas xiejunii TaxID=2968083 RepID=A0ABY5KSN4_9CELL|nr:DUF4235 domain-containing protein [Cellulomonas xiejunii]MCC2314969.1 DUF4235 domain-containing protein [Cellulomonas xiejunii]MCC2321561.1 DUF4235 domain-containing protein [Cellulomonas xiejunii]MCC2323287.1 DUF4235 domain-containing protein [Cellulomonas xiejunii]UUI72130.1 DUF4235 domain-containing protein [Cellulomonas xiejunii]